MTIAATRDVTVADSRDTPARSPKVAAPRVLYVLKRFPQLSQTFVVREIVELERLGVSVGIDALGAGPDMEMAADVRAPVRFVERRPRLRYPRVLAAHARSAARHPVVWWRAARQARRGEWRRFVQAGLVADRARRERFGHLHAHFASAAAEVARDAAALAGCTYSVTAHAKDIFHDDHVGQLRDRLIGAAAVVTVSDFNRRHLVGVVPTVRVDHIPNGVALAPVADRRCPEPGRALCVARLVDKKGIDTLLQSWAKLVADRPDARLEVIGDGPELESLQALATTLGISRHVEWRGAQPFAAVEAAYARAALFALPCRVTADGDRDGLPTAIVEAMAHGVPVISTAIIGIPEAVVDGVTGLLVPPDDAPALAHAMARVLDDRSLAAALGDGARRLVAERFDPRGSAVALSDLFAAIEGR